MRLRSLALVALSAATLVACTDTPSDTIRIGTIDANQREWHVFQELAREHGFDIEIVTYGDYTTPNDALANGQLDLNNFQHLSYLGGYNVRAEEDLTPIASTAIYPLGLYFDGTLADVRGEEVAIPHDAANQGRAINLLRDAGLVTLRDGAPVHPTPSDIVAPESEVTVRPVAPADVVEAFQDGSAAIIPSSELEPAGVDAADALASDDPADTASEPYTYVWVTTPDKVDDPRLNELVDLWHDPAVDEAVIESSRGTAVPVDEDRAELERILDLEERWFGR